MTMSNGAWAVTWLRDGTPCVYPTKDLRPHVVIDGQCWCRPFIYQGVMVHNSLDRREEYEHSVS